MGGLSALVIALAFVAEAPTSSASPSLPDLRTRPLLVFQGNLVLNDEIYRIMLNLPSTATASPDLATAVEDRVYEFLHRAGYVLASVKAKVIDDQILLEINEGRLDKVIFLGENAIDTLRLDLEINLPYKIFNRPALERQLKELSTRLNLEDVRYELRQVRGPAAGVPTGPQLHEIGPISELPFLQPGMPYELLVYLRTYDWSRGISPDLSVNSLEGFGIGATYRNSALVLGEDRYVLRAKLAGNDRTSLAHSSYPAITRALVEGAWFTPPIEGPVARQRFRGVLSVLEDYLNRQRADLNLNSFNLADFETAFRAEYVFMAQLSASAGVGYLHRILFGIDHTTTTPNPSVDLAPPKEDRLFEQVGVRWIFDPDEIRLDKRGQLSLEERWYALLGPRGSLLAIDSVIAKVFALGWDELRLGSIGGLRAGNVQFPDELPAAAIALHGPFGDQIYVRKFISFNAEYRFSIERDIVKLGLFHDLIVYGAIDRTTNDQSRAAANAFGVSLHALLLDSFTFDAYIGFGFAANGQFGSGLALGLGQAF
jgi:hypothetical protein